MNMFRYSGTGVASRRNVFHFVLSQPTDELKAGIEYERAWRRRW